MHKSRRGSAREYVNGNYDAGGIRIRICFIVLGEASKRCSVLSGLCSRERLNQTR